jgi:alcohol dehydrogenase (cytochrome c)
MNRTSRGALIAGGALALGLGIVPVALAQGGAAADSPPSPGRTAYLQNCAACHGATLDNGEFAPALKGPDFLTRWKGASVDKVDTYIRASMPPAKAGSLDPATATSVLAYILSENSVATGGVAIESGSAALAKISLPQPPAAADTFGGVGGVSKIRKMPPWPMPVDPFTHWKPVTEAELANPAPQDWPAWRRSHLGQGWSPLKQITTANVSRLGVAWSQALPAGEAITEPLERDGVLYVMGAGDQIFAFDAVNGRMLWRYQRTLPKDARTSGKKTIALYGDKLYTATSDIHMVALDARTGRPVWDVPVTDIKGFRILGGPLVAKGVVMQGTTGQVAGGALIAGFDAETGEKLWTFNTIAQPGQPGGDTWNGLPADKRSGASVWTSGSYDPETGLALWGTAQTYDTGPLRDRKPGLNNDGLYTDSTLAFEPRSGKLVWYYQHMRNDQFDLDWVFDRVIGTLDVKGRKERVVITGGKEGLFDAVEAKTGKYLKTVDMGFQNVVTHIDPVTGDKTQNPDLIPDRTKTRYACPHGGGGRNWSPTAWDESKGRLFVNARDVCADIIPTQGRGFLSTGINENYSPPPNSDGTFGMIQALDMATGKTVWKTKQRAPWTMGMLATGGGLLFSGSIDRQFTAYDQATGKVLWKTHTAGIPNASAISYSVNGKQYVAMITGYGNPLSLGLGDFTPEIELPPVVSSAVTVFALPD